MKMHNKSKVLLCLPQWIGRNHGFFLGIAALAASLQETGHEVVVFDEDVLEYALKHGAQIQPNLLANFINNYSPTLIGIYVNTPNYAAALSLAQKIRSVTDAPIVAGGPHATAAAKTLLSRHPEIDFVLAGEADITLPLLATAVRSCRSFSRIPGLAFLKEGRVHFGPMSPRVDLPSLPVPCREALENPPIDILAQWASQCYQENFYSSIGAFEGRKTTNAYASRGCVQACPFCSPGHFWLDPLHKIPHRAKRHVANLRNELRSLRGKGFEAVYFDEAAFPFNDVAWLNELTKVFTELDMFWGGAALFREVAQAPLSKLAESGLRYLYFGLESPLAELQEKAGKEVAASDAASFVARCHDIGIQCDVSIFFGIPGENERTIEQTIQWLDKNLPYGNAFFSIAALWPGTPWAVREGLTPEHWEPDYEKRESPGRPVWYGHDLTAIGKFYSNSLGTYHPAFMTPNRALEIKDRIISSGFRSKFSKYARTEKS